MKRTKPMKRGKPLQRRVPLRATPSAKTEVRILKSRKCPVKKGGCGVVFRPAREKQIACLDCAAPVGRWLAAAKAKEEHADDVRRTKARLRELEPISKSLDRAEKAVNRYVRARDFHLGCVSCDLPANWDGQWHASHLRSVGAATAVRFHLWNIHKACWICNKLFSGRIDAYKPQAIARIGAEKVDWLYTQTQVVKHSREHLARLASVFNKKAARQEKRNANR